MPWLCIEEWNSQKLVSIRFFKDSHENDKHIKLKKIEITEADAALTIDILTRLFQQEVDEAFSQAPAKSDAYYKLLETLEGIIKTSHFEGERSNAKDLYKKVTGKTWKD